ncbi:hypothetical protein [Desulforamulus ruminis]|uniref:Uncharacterized protein n=1 Tax=Desulforamulus ruminis (strain ATCC 23193 / DSM 2154 / NCIMB 8452 / DL) TaxID=696281 RepID=F6DU21_DESRL|nr:hypothetical protein [Desulforamulus ruminis]AEG60096.1 hypothetical protein Desru_1834 [Desulforamulus ruminis DSM 2154]
MKNVAILLILLILLAVWFFMSVGVSLPTIFIFLGWLLLGLGLLAFIGGDRRGGIIAIILGIILSNIHRF